MFDAADALNVQPATTPKVAENSKCQIPRPKELPRRTSSKQCATQRSNLQVWGFGICLGFGAWDLAFRRRTRPQARQRDM